MAKTNTAIKEIESNVEKESEKQVEILVSEKDYVDLSDKKKAAETIFKLAETGVTATHKAYRLLQVAVVNVLRHVEKHGDPSILDSFLKMIEDGYLPARSMGMFVEKYSPAFYNLDSKRWELKPKKAGKAFEIAKASQTPWWKANGKSKASPWNMYIAFNRLIQAIESHEESTKEGEVFDDKLADDLMKVAKKYQIHELAKVELNEVDDSESVESEKVA